MKIQAENSKTTKALIDVCEKIDVGFVGSMVHAYSDETGVPLLQTQNIKQFFIDTSNLKYIQSWFHAELAKSQIFPGDVLIARSGSIGNAAVVTKSDFQPLNSSDIIIIRPKGLNEYYLCAYINSKFGQIQIERLSSGGVQGHINLGALETIDTPIPSPDFQKQIEKTVKSAHAKLEQSKRLYAEAEETLLEELGLKNWRPPKESISVKSFSESFGKSGRLDAEYYQPKYQRLIALLKKNNQSIGDVAKLAKRQFQPEKGKEFNYIEISDISSNSGEISSEVLFGEDAPSRAQWIVETGDVISSTVRPIRRLSALVTDEQNGFVCSSGFAVLKPETIESEVLFSYLRLPIICELMDLFTSSSMYPAISTSDLLDIPMPNIDKGTRKSIVSIIQKARTANQESKRLLELSKRAVESAIEKGESKGMKMLIE